MSTVVAMVLAGTVAVLAPLRAALVTFATADHYPAAVAVDDATRTVYVVNNGTNDVSVIEGARCNARTTRGCAGPHPRQDVGDVPSALALDRRTRTLYVANYTSRAHGSISIVDATRCNARHPGGCTHFPRLPPALTLPFQPNDIAIDQRTDTVYAAGSTNTLAVIDGRRCRRGASAGCQAALHTATVPSGAGAVAFDPRSRTLYVLGYFSGRMAVMDGRRCTAASTRGCGHVTATVRLGRHPWRAAIDPASDTLYVTNFGARTVAVIDARRCNGTVTAGCRSIPALLHVGRGPEGLAFDDRLRAGVVTNSLSNTVSFFDTTRCRAGATAGCAQPPVSVRVGRLPDGVAVEGATATVYVTDNAEQTVAVLTVTRGGVP